MDSNKIETNLADFEDSSTRSPNLLKKMFSKKNSSSRESSVEGEKEMKELKRKKSKKTKTRTVDSEIAKLRSQLGELVLCQNQIRYLRRLGLRQGAENRELWGRKVLGGCKNGFIVL